LGTFILLQRQPVPEFWEICSKKVLSTIIGAEKPQYCLWNAPVVPPAIGAAVQAADCSRCNPNASIEGSAALLI
jgi:hypothetical protein